VNEHIKQVVDTVSIATVLASLAAWLPPIAALISIVWGLIRIYETDTVQHLLGLRKKVEIPEKSEW
jgi:hypothetical protein